MSHRKQKLLSIITYFQLLIIWGLQAALIFAFLLLLEKTILAKNPLEISSQLSITRELLQDDQNNQLLEPNKPIKSEMSGGQRRKYLLRLKEGEYAHVVVEQRGIDVVVKLSVQGREILKVDSPNGTQGPENVRVVAENSGDYEVEVSSSEGGAKQGQYEIRIEELRVASQQDRYRIAVNRILTEAQQLNTQNDEQSKISAIAKYEEARKLWQLLTDAQSEGETLFLIGAVYTSLHNAQKALEYYNRALTILQPLGKSAMLASLYNEIGAVYATLLDNPQKALENYERAWPILHNLPNRLSEAIMLNNIGQVYSAVNNPQKAFEYFNRAVPIYQKLEDNAPGKATLLSNIGYISFLMRKPQKALKYYAQALQLYRKQPDSEHEARTLNNIGQVEDSLGRKQDALGNYMKARGIFHNLGARLDEVVTLGNIGLVYESLDRKQEAINSYQEGIDILESLRSSTTIEEIRASLWASTVFVYKAGLLLVSLGQGERAFNLTEYARARTFLDQLGNVRPNFPKTTNDQLTKDKNELEARITSLEQKLEQAGSEPPSGLEAEYTAAQRSYEDLILRLKLTSPNYEFRSVQTLNLPEIQRLLRDDVTLLSYFVGPDKTWAFVITRNSFRAVEIQLKETELIDQIVWLRRFPSLRTTPTKTLKQLYGWLIAPLKQYINTTMVGIIPHRELHYLPFAALTDGQNYFGDEHTLFYLPSASALPFLRNSKPVGASMLALAQSRVAGLRALQYVDEEAEVVANIYDTQALTTGKASKSEFLKRAEESSIIHIAAHTELNTASPLFYRIRLGADKGIPGMLEVRDIYNLNLTKTSLVVLSACQTDLGAHSMGDDIIALNRAFMYAGASTVIASLWTVDDESTGYMMKSFYTHLKQGMGKAEALRLAQLDTRQKYPHPYYWAAFVLTGDPGTSEPVLV
jgi:CHAT domain-containing protein/Tfp pilus assembly protein PilF